MTFSAFLGRFLSIPSNIIIAKALGASGFGILAIINLIIKYAGYFDLGALKCLTRNATMAYGEKNYQKGNQIKDVVFTVMSISTAFPLILLWILYFCGITFNNVLNNQILFFISLILLSNKLIAYFKASMISDGEFKLIANIDLIDKVLIPISAILLVILFEIEGLLLSILLINFLKVAYIIIYYKNIRVVFNFSLKKILDQLQTGIMLYLNGLAEAFLLSFGVIISSKYFSQSEIGIYAFASGIILSKSIPFASPINMYVTRKIFFEKGNHGKIYDTYDLLNKYHTHYVIFHTTVLGSILLLFNYITKYFLTEYIPSVELMLILYFGYIIYISQLFYKIFLDAYDKLKHILFCILTGIFFIALFCWLLINNGYSIENISIAVSIGFTITTILMQQSVFRLINKNIFNAALKTFKVILISFVLTFSLYQFNNWDIIKVEDNANLFLILFYSLNEFSIKLILFFSENLILFSLLYPKTSFLGEIKSIYYMYSVDQNKRREIKSGKR